MFRYAIIILVMVSIALISWRLRYLTTHTKGMPITNESQGVALLVIDMQEGIVNQPQYNDQEKLIRYIQQAIADANPQTEIIFIKHSINKHPIDSLLTAGRMQTGTSETDIIDALAPFSQTVFQKHRADAFSSSAFETYLREHQIKHLYLVGADAGACIYQTALGGLNRGYSVTILENGLFATSPNRKNKLLTTYQKRGITIA